MSLAAVVADDLVDLDDDVLGNLGLYRSAIDHLCEGYALVIILCDRYLAEHFIFASNYDADEITRYIGFPCGIFLQSNDVSRLDNWFKLDKTEHVPPLKTVKSVQFWS